MSPDIIAFGEPMLEFNQAPGTASTTYMQGFGGDTSNFIIAAARQGARTGYITALGDDVYGNLLLELWTREGVVTSCVLRINDAYTAVYFVTHDAAGHHFSFFRTGSAASRYRPSDLPLRAISNARLFHLSGISLAISASACDSGFAAIAAARAAGVQVSFDTNLRLKLWPLARASAIIDAAITQCDICLPSYDDVVALFGETDADRIVDRILAKGPRIVALKLGAEGALVADANRRFRITPFSCKPVDATGAGDTFGGAFTARLLAGDDIDAAGNYAAAAAALSTQGYGAVAPIPFAHQVQAARAAARAT